MILSTVHFHPYLHLGSALGGRVLLKMESPPLYAPWGLFTPLALWEGYGEASMLGMEGLGVRLLERGRG